MDMELHGDLDLDEVWENISDTVREMVRSEIDDNAWDAVSDHVEEAVEEGVRSYIEYNEPNISEPITDLLQEYVDQKSVGSSVCRIGLVFEAAVEQAIPVTLRPNDSSVSDRVDKLETKVNTLLGALQSLGERAARVDERGWSNAD